MNIVESTRNQLGNARNPHQGPTKKVLCVCSAGLLRSPTLAKAIGEAYGFNTRAVGACKPFALIPISEALLIWADEIVFVDFDAYQEAMTNPEDKAKICAKFGANEIKILDILDRYDWGAPELVEACLQQYGELV